MNNYRFWKGEQITSMTSNNIFVFGSNPEGRHGAGAAKAAVKFGALYGQGRGLRGNTYALITKNLTSGFKEENTGIVYSKKGYKSVSPEQISDNISELYECARKHPNCKFFIVYKHETWDNGSPKKSLNGYTSHEMFEFFTKDKVVPENIRFHESFKALC